MSSAPHTPFAGWTRRPERGSLFLVRFMAWASVAAGRRPSRLLLYPIAVYFFCTAGAARARSREYLRRVLGREASLAELFRLYLHFATTLHDRVFFLRGRFDCFSIEVRGAELFDAAGAVLLGAHFGSFEALRACGRRLGARRVVMAMYEALNPRLLGVLTAVDPSAPADIVALGRVDAMIALEARLEAGDLVGLLADRSLGNEATLEIDFLGGPARFPTGPMRLAAVLGRRVILMAGLYRGGNRYEIRFEPLADFSTAGALTREERARRVDAGVREYARRLEALCREAPSNWFNFHDFWMDCR